MAPAVLRRLLAFQALMTPERPTTPKHQPTPPRPAAGARAKSAARTASTRRQRQPPLASDERRQQARAAQQAKARRLVPLRTLQQRLEEQDSGDYFLLRNASDILEYEHRFAEVGFSCFHEFYCQLTNQLEASVPKDEPRRRLRPARHIAPEEAWQSNMHLSALQVVARHGAEERAAFFAKARRVAKDGG